jgi:hypothetical protein
VPVVPVVPDGTCGGFRYWTTPSSDRARRSSKSIRLEMNRTRIFMFLDFDAQSA